MNRDTRIQHEGDDRESHGGGAAPPIYRTSLFTFESVVSFEAAYENAMTTDGPTRPLYSRVSNPTVRMLERKLADLEEVDDAIALGSGMAAVSATLLGLLRQGDHVVMLASSYVPTLATARGLERFGIETTFLPADGLPRRLPEAITERTKLIYIESPASLTFELVDLAAVAELASSRGLITTIDNSWATPVHQRPARFGIDLSLHSGTKYLGGHSDLLFGAVAGSRELIATIRETAVLLGATLSPEDAFLAIRGLRTLPIRMARHGESALRLARFLEARPEVARVLCPGLESFPNHALAKRQLDGTSGLFSFELASDFDPRRFVDALDIFRVGVSWGGFESLALPIVSTMPAGSETPLREDIPSGLVRLSIGLEDIEDLEADLARALEASRA